MSENAMGDTEHECHTVKCHKTATETLRIESDYESVSGETRTITLEKEFCNEHAEMWLGYNHIEGRRYEVVGDPRSVDTGTDQ